MRRKRIPYFRNPHCILLAHISLREEIRFLTHTHTHTHTHIYIYTRSWNNKLITEKPRQHILRGDRNDFQNCKSRLKTFSCKDLFGTVNSLMVRGILLFKFQHCVAPFCLIWTAWMVLYVPHHSVLRGPDHWGYSTRGKPLQKFLSSSNEEGKVILKSEFIFQSSELMGPVQSI